MLDFAGLVLPTQAVALITFAILVASSVFFVDRQRVRGFTMVTIWRVVGIAAGATLLAMTAQLVSQSSVTVCGGLTMAVTASLLFLLGMTALTDFTIHKIPTESAWLPAFFGVGAFLLTVLGPCGVEWTLDRIFVVTVLAILPLTAFVSVLFGAGGAADFRVSMAGFLATAWWVSPAGLVPGLAAFVVFTLVGRLVFSKPSPKGNGRRMTPAGPAYVSLFAVAAVVSLLVGS